MSTPIIVKDGQSTPAQQTLQLPDISTAGNPKIAIAEPLPAGTNAIGSITNVSGTVSLPTGAATASNQSTGNTSLGSLDTKLPAQGQALAAASLPVVLPALQITALTPPANVGLNAGSNAIGSITNTGFASTQSGTWTIQPGNTANTTPWLFKLGDGTNTVGLLNLTNSKPIPTAIVDGSGTQITSFGGGTQYADGAIQATPTGTALLWNDAGVVRVPSAAKPLPVRDIDTTTTGNITVADAGSTSNTVSATGQTIVTGIPTANSFVSAALNACSTFTVQLTGTFVATVAFESSIDGGTTWVPINLILRNVGTSMGAATTIGVWRGAAAGLTNVRVRCTAFASGAIAVTIGVSKGVENVFVGNGVKAAAYTLTDRSGTTSGTINTKTQVAAANTSRGGGGVIIENISTTASLQVWIGASGVETKYPSGLLPPANSASYGVTCQVTSTDRVSISSIDTASVAFVAVEGVNS